ncbi:hypothetical protein GCM10027347_58850 [Larkinella harenae]
MPDLPKTHGKLAHSARRHVDPKQVRNSNEMGYTYRWQKFRLAFLRKHPLCIACQKKGIVTAATDVDHVVPHRGDPIKFWAGPFQALCKPCHSAKTARGG